MRRRALVGAVILTLAALEATWVGTVPSSAAAATARTGAFGTASIDGIARPDEWSSASALAVRPSIPGNAGGGDGRATLFLMSDSSNIYVALRLAGVYDRVTLTMQFYGDSWDIEDQLEVAVERSAVAPGPLPFRDMFVGPGAILDDTQSGAGAPPPGTVDGRAAGGVDLVSTYIELAHPMASADAAHDIHVSPGAALRVNLGFSIFSAGGAASCGTPACWGGGGIQSGSDLVLAVSPARFSTPDELAAAIRIRSVRVSPVATVAGGAVRISYQVVNTSSRHLVAPLDPISGHHSGGYLTEVIEPRTSVSVGALQPSPDGTAVVWTPRVLDVLSRFGGTVWPAGAAFTFASSINTAGFPAGDYWYRITALRPDGSSSSSAPVARFVLKGLRDEWTTAIGKGGSNGTAKVRGYTTGDGVASLALRGLTARRSYTVTIAADSCRGRAVASIGTVTAGSSGRATRSIPLSSTKVQAIDAASARGTVYLRLASGATSRCGILSPVSLWPGSLQWQLGYVERLQRRVDQRAVGAMTDVVLFGSRLLAVGFDQAATGSVAVVWSSDDGMYWIPSVLPGRGGRSMIASGNGLAVVVWTGAAWHSRDGTAWLASSAPPSGEVVPGARTVASLPNGFVALTLAPSAQSWGPRTAIAWSTADGDRWTALAQDPDLVDFQPTALASARGTLVAVGSESAGRGRVVTSVDGGATWTRIDAFGQAGGWDGVSVVSSGFILYGLGGVWRSGDGMTWSPLASFPPRDQMRVIAGEVVDLGQGLVAVGAEKQYMSDVDNEYARSEVLTSGDGSTWKWAPWPPGWAGTQMLGAVVWQGRLVVVGDTDPFNVTIGQPVAWCASLR